MESHPHDEIIQEVVNGYQLDRGQKDVFVLRSESNGDAWIEIDV